LYYHLVLIAQRKISVLAIPVTSSSLRYQAPLFTEIRLLHGTKIDTAVFLPSTWCAEDLQGTHLEHKNKPSEMKVEIVQTQSLQDHCSYKAPTTNHHQRKLLSKAIPLRWWYNQLLSKSSPHEQTVAFQIKPHVGGASLRWWY